MTTAAQRLHAIPIEAVRAGDVIDYGGRLFKVFRRVLCEPGGWVLLAAPQDVSGGWDSEARGLVYANARAEVLLVIGGELR